jgi:hypothetical protein
MCPNSCDVIVVAFILLQASKKCGVKNARYKNFDDNLLFWLKLKFEFRAATLNRRTYQASFLFSWNIETGRYNVTRTSSLKEADALVGTQWHPARMERDSMRLSSPPIMTHPKVRELTNLSVLLGELIFINYSIINFSVG